MTEKEIFDYNHKCALFIGGKQAKDTLPFIKERLNENDYWLPKYGIKSLNQMKFYSDWNWIMKVIERIKYIEDNQEKFFGDDYYLIHFEIDLLHGVDLFIDKKRLFGQTAFGEYQLKEAVVQAINQFLIWYNKQTNNKNLKL